MNDKERHDFFKDLYDKEFSRKEVIENSVNTPISITTAATVLIYFIVSEYDRSSSAVVIDAAFFCLVALSALFTLIGLFFLIKMYVNIYHQKYRAIPYADELEAYRGSLQTYYTTNAALLGHTTADALFLNYLTDQYIQQTTANTRTNDTKLKELELTKRALTLAVLLAFLSLLPFFYNFLTKPEKTYLIDLKRPLTPSYHDNSLLHPTPRLAPPTTAPSRPANDGRNRP